MERQGGLVVLDAEAVQAGLSVEAAIPVVREAMIALSSGQVKQLLRSFIGLGGGRTFAIMPGAMGDGGRFGAKLISVIPDGAGRKAHEGVVVLFDGADGAPICVADAGMVTAVRTAAASAVATDALARKDASVLAVLGTGRQAEAHIQAIGAVRELKEIRVWGRDPGRTAAFAEQFGAAAGDVRSVVEGADIVCTVTAAPEPILEGGWVSPGAHVNVVGSSGPTTAEIDTALVAASRFFVDHREHVLAHGGEFRRARDAGAVTDAHIAAEIGEVLAGRAGGRASSDEITLYKALGHAAQDLACAIWLYDRAAA